MGARQAGQGWDYRPRLEAFLRAVSIDDPAASATQLSKRYATLVELLSADPVIVADYANVPVAEALAGARGLMIWALEEELRRRRPIRSYRELKPFLKALIGFRCDELLVVLLLDSGGGLIDYDTYPGRVDSVDFDERQIMLRALGRGAAGIIVAHNHPSGDPKPSSNDFIATRRIADGARAFRIQILDHLVVAGGEVRSAMFSAN